MHYTGTTYRPPYEANSILLQVTTGCSHNACTFCTMYRDVAFDISPMDEIEADILEAARVQDRATRVFLLNGDAFVLPAERLLAIAELVHEHLPNVKSIGAYASIKSIQNKTDEQLVALAQAGYADINIGVESALDDVLELMNKGYSRDTAKAQMMRLNAAGMHFNVNIINAAAGPSRIVEHAAANAQLINEVRPTLVFVSPLHIDPGSELEGMAAEGAFEECTLGEYIQEEIELLSRLQLSNCLFFGLHVSNPVGVAGFMPRDKQKMLDELEEGRSEFPQEMLDSHPRKGHEGTLR